jgi:glycolate oxidase iron-sulfur subunit
MPEGTAGWTRSENARHNIALFEQAGVDVIVTDCATCGSALKEYRALLEDNAEWASRAANLAAKYGHQRSSWRRYLEAAGTHRGEGHVSRPLPSAPGTHVWKQSRSLLAMIGLEFVELPDADWCCGSGHAAHHSLRDVAQGLTARWITWQARAHRSSRQAAPAARCMHTGMRAPRG